MRKSSFLILASIILFSCSPILRQDSIDRATFNYKSSEIKQNPTSYKGTLFVFGGIIASTTLVERGSLIEALYVPVNAKGYLKNVENMGDRYLAIYAKEYGFLDPMIFRKGSEITVAGQFIGLEAGKINEMDYIFPVFRIEEVHLWTETSKKNFYTSDSYHTPRFSDDGKIQILYKSSGYLQGVDNSSHQRVQNESSENRDGTKSAGVKAAEPSDTQEATSKNEMLESPVADDMLIEKSEVQELPISEEQAAVEEKALELPKAEKGVDGQKFVIQRKKSFDGMYYVQIGAWKNSDLAEKMFNKVREKYHETHMVVENYLHKVRILGVRTKQKGMDISQDIEKTFNIRPIVVRNPQ